MYSIHYSKQKCTNKAIFNEKFDKNQKMLKTWQTHIAAYNELFSNKQKYQIDSENGYANNVHVRTAMKIDVCTLMVFTVASLGLVSPGANNWWVSPCHAIFFFKKIW